MVSILQYMLSVHALHLKYIQCYMSVTSVEPEGGKGLYKNYCLGFFTQMNATVKP